MYIVHCTTPNSNVINQKEGEAGGKSEQLQWYVSHIFIYNTIASASEQI